jgi:hypothetical protein
VGGKGRGRGGEKELTFSPLKALQLLRKGLAARVDEGGIRRQSWGRTWEGW